MRIKKLTHPVYHSSIIDGLTFIYHKPYLITCFILYFVSIFLADFFADHLSIYIRDTLTSIGSNKSSLPFFVTRYILWDGFFIVGIFGSIVLFFSIPSIFCCFMSFQKFAKESFWMSFFRVLLFIFLSSLALTLLFAGLQGFFWLAPRYLFGCILYYFGKTGKTFEESDIIFDNSFGFLEEFNLSLIFLFLIRIGVLITILQGLILKPKSRKLFSSYLLLVPLLFFIVVTSTLFNGIEYPSEGKKGEYKILNPKDKIENTIKDTQPTAKIESQPLVKITIYDPNTGEIISNNESNND